MLLATYRIDEVTRAHPFYSQLPALVRESGGLRLDLRPLDRDDLGQLAEKLLGGLIEETDRLAAYLERRSEGNPFFAVELLRALYENGSLARSEQSWQILDLDESTVPSYLQQVIDSRVDRLGADVCEALEIAAIIGQQVPVDLWVKSSGLPEEVLCDIADLAAEARLIVVERDGRSISFHHALTREALYERVSPFQRRIIHGKVARCLLQNPHPDPDAVAFHLQQAGDPEAVTWLIRAGERSQRAYAWLTAQERFLSAVELLRGLPGQEEQLALLLFRVARLKRYSDQHRGVAMMTEASSLARAAGKTVLAADADHNKALLLCWAGDFAIGLANWESVFADLEAASTGDDQMESIDTQWLVDSMPSAGVIADSDAALTMKRLRSAGVSHRRGANAWLLAASGKSAEGRAEAEQLLSVIGDVSAPGPLVQSSTGHAWYTVGLDAATRGRRRNGPSRLRRCDHALSNTRSSCTDRFCRTRAPGGCHPAVRDRSTSGTETGRAAAARSLKRAGGAFADRTNFESPWYEVHFLDGRWESAGASFRRSRRSVHLPSSAGCPSCGCWTGAGAGGPGKGGRDHSASVAEWFETPFFSTHLPESVALQLEAAHTAMDHGDLAVAERWLEMARSWSEAGGSVFTGRRVRCSERRGCTRCGGDRWRSFFLKELAKLQRQRRMPLVALQSSRLEGSILLEKGDLGKRNQIGRMRWKSRNDVKRHTKTRSFGSSWHGSAVMGNRELVRGDAAEGLRCADEARCESGNP